MALAEGRMYTGSAEGHCTEWSNKLLKWPQTSVGRKASECRIRAKKYKINMIMGKIHLDHRPRDYLLR